MTAEAAGECSGVLGDDIGDAQAVTDARSRHTTPQGGLCVDDVRTAMRPYVDVDQPVCAREIGLCAEACQPGVPARKPQGRDATQIMLHHLPVVLCGSAK